MNPADNPETLQERREEVMDELTAHFANEALSTDEFDERVDLAQRATSTAELDGLLSDLDELGSYLVTRDEPRSVARETRAGRPGRILSLLSSIRRKGTWYVPEYLPVVTLMGAIELDFREADLGTGITEIDVTNVMGGIKVVVPHDLQVECNGHAVMGQFQSLERGTVDPDPDAPVLRITGFVVMGSLEIKVKERRATTSIRPGH